jgi:hypothetical protein
MVIHFYFLGLGDTPFLLADHNGPLGSHFVSFYQFVVNSLKFQFGPAVMVPTLYILPATEFSLFTTEPHQTAK